MKKLVFDIGANQGEYTDHVRKLYPGVHVVCVEPNLSLCNRLSSKYDASSVTVYHAAVSESEGLIEFHECSQDSSVSTVSKVFLEKSCFTTSEKIMSDGRTFKDHYNYNSPVIVRSITLDSLVGLHGTPDLIKLDVEGHELNVIMGLSSKIPLITFEWHEEFKDRVLESIDRLHSIGFTKFSTEIWRSSIDYHDREPIDSDYKTLQDFKTFFTESLALKESEVTRNYITRSGMIWSK